MNDSETYLERYQRLLAPAEKAANVIQNGDSVVLSGGACQPLSILSALGRRRDLQRVNLYTSLSLVPPDFLVRQYLAKKEGKSLESNVSFFSFCVGPGSRESAQASVVNVVPVSGSAVGRLLQGRRVDVIVAGSSGMDEDGNFNLSCNVDWMQDILSDAMHRDTVVVVEVNRNLPWTEGETTFRIEAVDMVVESERAVPDLPAPRSAPEARSIGGHLSLLVPDEATLHLGMGELVNQSVIHLDVKRDLGVHSDFIGDGMLHLYEKGAITNRKKDFMPGKWLGSYVLGSRDLYDFVERNAMVALHPTDFVAEPANISRNRRMVSITQATQVDITGQIAGQSREFEFLSNPGIQHGFHAAASASAEGIGITVLTSATSSGRVSNIVPAISPGTAVAIPRGDADCVVTEYGIARLKGKSLSERALNLIAVAHPSHRDLLAREARQLGLL